MHLLDGPCCRCQFHLRLDGVVDIAVAARDDCPEQNYYTVGADAFRRVGAGINPPPSQRWINQVINAYERRHRRRSSAKRHIYYFFPRTARFAAKIAAWEIDNALRTRPVSETQQQKLLRQLRTLLQAAAEQARRWSSEARARGVDVETAMARAMTRVLEDAERFVSDPLEPSCKLPLSDAQFKARLDEVRSGKHVHLRPAPERARDRAWFERCATKWIGGPANAFYARTELKLSPLPLPRDDHPDRVSAGVSFGNWERICNEWAGEFMFAPVMLCPWGDAG